MRIVLFETCRSKILGTLLNTAGMPSPDSLDFADVRCMGSHQDQANSVSAAVKMDTLHVDPAPASEHKIAEQELLQRELKPEGMASPDSLEWCDVDWGTGGPPDETNLSSAVMLATAGEQKIVEQGLLRIHSELKSVGKLHELERLEGDGKIFPSPTPQTLRWTFVRFDAFDCSCCGRC